MTPLHRSLIIMILAFALAFWAGCGGDDDPSTGSGQADDDLGDDSANGGTDDDVSDDDVGDDDLLDDDLADDDTAVDDATTDADLRDDDTADAENNTERGQQRAQLVKQEVLDPETDVAGHSDPTHQLSTSTRSISPSRKWSRCVV